MPKLPPVLRILILAALVATLASSPAAAIDENRIVSIFGVVEPGTLEVANFTVFRGTAQIASGDLDALLRPGGGWRLLVTGIAAHLNTGPFPPDDTDYAAVSLGRCAATSFGGFGAGSLVVGGTHFAQHDLSPGLVVWLGAGDQLCLSSLIQSTVSAHVQLHGVLQRAE